MPAERISKPTIAAFARQLIEVAHQTASGPAIRRSLPGLTLDAIVHDEAYAAAARRTLIDGERPDDDRLPIAVVSVDASTRPDLPRPQWEQPQVDLRQVVDGLEDAGLAGGYSEYDIWQFYDPTSRKGIQLLASADRMPPWDTGFPLRQFLHWAYQARGWQLVHGGTLGIAGKGCLLAGGGGAGKSGTVLGGLLSGLDTVGDDYLAVSLAGGPTAHAVNRAGKQDAAGMARLGLQQLAGRLAGPNWQNKYEFAFDQLGPGRLVPRLELCSILLPRRSGADRSTVTPAHAREAMSALALSSLAQLVGGWRQSLHAIAELARAIPAFWLDLGPDPREISDTITKHLQMR